MQRYADKAALIEAKAQAQHAANLAHGGVFDADCSRCSDIAIERQDAQSKVLYVGAPYSKFHGLPETISAWYIQGFGYSPA